MQNRDLPTIRVLEFKSEYKKRNGEMVEVEWVRIAPVSAIMTSQVWHRIKDLLPPDEISNDDDGKKIDFMRHRWSMIEPAYNAWKSGNEVPLGGTPLAAWGGVTPEQSKLLQQHGFRTVEEIAEMTESSIVKLPIPRLRELPALARKFLDGIGTAENAERLTALEDQIKDLAEKLAAAMELLEQATGGKNKKAA